MDIGRPISIERISERLPSEETRGSVKSKKKGSAGGRPYTDSAPAASKVAEFLTPINFEYLPSGKIQLNREAREQIIDFFE